MRLLILLACAALATVVSGAALADCPTGKKVGDTWCQDGKQWKCDSCGSELCPIITGKSCFKDDPANPIAQNGVLERIARIATRRNADTDPHEAPIR